MTRICIIAASVLIAVLWLVPGHRDGLPRGVPQHTVLGWVPTGSGRVRSWWQTRRRRREDPRDDAARIGAALTSVAARLRAGQSPERAWEAVAEHLPCRLGSADGALARPRAQHRAGPGTAAGSPALAAALAATELAHDLGAELAPVLEAAAQGIEEAARAHGERETALAGPRATARLLLALPVLGLVAGTLIGARPWELLTTTIWGGAILMAAAGLVAGGRAWIAHLTAQAEAEGAA